MATDRHSSVVRFGPFEADLHACELRKNGAKVRLPNQPFQVLAMLLAQPGDVVTRDQLQKRLWADDTFVDFDRGLNKAINRLREALGDSADDPHLVETLPKRGYRFIAPVDAASHTVSDGAAAERGESMRGSSPWLMRVAMATALAAALGLAGSLMIGRRPPGPVNVVRSSLLPPRGTSFAPHHFALSPDGTQLAFSAANPDGTLGLWVRSLSAATARRVDQTEGARFPFWSPDNRRIGFFADRKLETVDLVNGTVRTLCDARRPRGGTWNANDVILFAPDVEGPLFQVPAAGGIPRPVLQASAHAASYDWPVFLPDGRHFLFTAPGGEQPSARLYAGSLDSSAPTLVLDRVTGMVAYSSKHLFFVRQGTLMAQRFSTEQLRASGPAVPIVEHELDAAFEPSTPDFSVAGGAVVIQSSLDFASRLTWIDPHGREVGAVGKPGDRDPALSPDGRLLATSCADVAAQSDICVYDLERGVATHVTHGGTDRFPVWSRDGKTLAYRAGDAALIFEVPADGSGPPHRIANLRGVPTDWSDDGHLLFFRPEQGTVALGTYAAATGGISSLASGSEAQFSPDGRWLLYGGQDGVGVRRLPDGPRIQISAYGGAQPRWSRDGRQIFYIDAPTRNMMAVGFDPASLRATPARILFQTRIVAPALASFQYDVARDGRLLINSLPADAPPFTLLIGWSSRLN
jgi:DNA-binding winged helix-turn-helix (wHTH) protein/Tol biopolymer transport system component